MLDGARAPRAGDSASAEPISAGPAAPAKAISMRPNIFTARSQCAEDLFSHGLAYVLSLLPHLGDRIASRIAVLSGRRPDYFGRFESCEFVAHEYQQGHRLSRPDLCLICHLRTIYFENKLDSPIRISQMKSHARLIRHRPNDYLVFVSNIQHSCPALCQLPRYVHPRDRDHFLWFDLLPAIDSMYRKGSHAARILADFGESLKLNGMVGRSIQGATGSLYTRGSEACALALDQLSHELRQVGFHVERRPQEATLRVYSIRGKYPLLNLRFTATATWLDPRLDFDALIFWVLSQPGDRHLGKRLARFVNRRDSKFFAYSFPDPPLKLYGYFVLPVVFTPGRGGWRIDFPSLTRPFKRILHSLSS